MLKFSSQCSNCDVFWVFYLFIYSTSLYLILFNILTQISSFFILLFTMDRSISHEFMIFFLHVDWDDDDKFIYVCVCVR